MPMSANLVVALCEQNAHSIREELHLIEAGDVKIMLRGDDVSDTEALRLRTNLGRLLEIIEAFGGPRN
jgi:hypothetical protein